MEEAQSECRPSILTDHIDTGNITSTVGTGLQPLAWLCVSMEISHNTECSAGHLCMDVRYANFPSRSPSAHATQTMNKHINSIGRQGEKKEKQQEETTLKSDEQSLWQPGTFGHCHNSGCAPCLLSHSLLHPSPSTGIHTHEHVQSGTGTTQVQNR